MRDKDVTFIERGNFTVCQVRGHVKNRFGRKGSTDRNKVVGYGFSKRNPMDELHPTLGKRLALHRALVDMVETYRTPKAQGATN